MPGLQVTCRITDRVFADISDVSRLILIVIALALAGVGCASSQLGPSTVVELTLETPGLRVYSRHCVYQNAPCTADLVKKNASGQLLERAPYRNGKLVGEVQGWYTDGTRAYVRHYQDGKKEGIQRGWHRNGALRFQSTYRHGLAEGISSEWYDNGRLYRQQVFEKGKEVSQKIWRETGQIYANYVVRDGRLYGLSGGHLCEKIEDQNESKETVDLDSAIDR